MKTGTYADESITLKSEFKAEDFPEKVIGNKGLRKKILRRGVSWQTPTPGDEVEGNYVRRFGNPMEVCAFHTTITK